MVRQAEEVTLCIRLRLRPPPRSSLGGSAPQMALPSSTSTSTTSSAVPRALISREHVRKSNTGKYKERGNSDPKNMSPRDRIEEFPGENCVFEVKNTEINNMHSCLYSELRALPGWRLKQVCRL